jgi:hypothetical protein
MMEDFIRENLVIIAFIVVMTILTIAVAWETIRVLMKR